MTTKSKREADDVHESNKRLKESESELDSVDELEGFEDDQITDTEIEPTESTGLGSIQSVQLCNFMCHSFLKVDLGDKINFITGQNGSGKSAILTAIAVALGGKAKFTNRAASISKLLKEGEDAGEVIVKIRNKGPDAYKYAEFGDTIIIERKIFRDSPSAPYKVKSATGKIVSTNKEELVSLCDHFQIEVENPMTILTQDTARMFLANSTPKEKYAFFLKGTQLERLYEDYDQLEDKMENIRGAIDRKRLAIPDIKKSLDQLEKQWQEMEKAKDLENNLNTLQGEKIWCKVAAIEAKLEDEKNEVEEYLRLMADAQSSISSLVNIIEEGERKGAQMMERLQTVTESSQPLQEKKANLEARCRAERAASTEIETEITTLESNLKSHNEQLKELKSRIHVETLKLNERSQNKANDLRYQLQVLEKRRFDETENVSEVKARILQLDRDREYFDSEQTRLMLEIEGRKNDLKRLEDQIRAVNAQKTDQLNAYGPNMKAIIADIEKYEKERRWRGKKPIGPFGRYIKLEDQRFQKIVETYLDKQLNAFGVETQDDLKLLQSILSNHRDSSSVFKYSYKKDFNFSKGQPSPQLRTMYNVLTIDHSVVLQQLIINSQIEKVVLVESHKEADALTEHRWPENVYNVYTRDCYQVGNRSGGLSSTSMNQYKGPLRLTSNLDAHLNDLFEDRRNLTDAIRKMEQEHGSNIAKLQGFNHMNLSYKNQLSSAEGTIFNLTNQINLKKERIESEDTSQLVQWQSMADDERKQIEIFRGSLNGLKIALKNKKVLFAELRSKFESVVNEIQSERKSTLNLRNEIDILKAEVSKAKSNSIHFETKFRQCQEKQNTAATLVRQTEANLQQQVQACSQYCSRVEVKRTEAEIDRELSKLNALLKEKERRFGSRELFYNKLTEKREIYRNAMKEMSDFAELMEYIASARMIRSRKLESFKKYISIRAKRIFSSLIQKRGYRGVLELDHEAGTLGLRVDVSSAVAEEEDAVLDKDPKALSGGEKSYATICLLLALWESMASPFRALDEFDVYMDAANRHLAMKLMVDHARDSANSSQYILISPQGASQKDLTGPDIRILKMREPERGQTTINFAPVSK